MSQTLTAISEQLFDRAQLKTAYQPIVDLESGEHVGAEALSRWPELHITPAAAFAWALDQGRLAELDRACSTAALDRALERGLAEGFALFVNLEPSTLDPATARSLAERHAGGVVLIAELTERSAHAEAAVLLRAVRELRSAGWMIALDDVGVNPDSVALLALLAPDIIKLDMSYVQNCLGLRESIELTSISAYVERTGAILLAEGIETHAHLRQALALGATLGQGWYFGYPAALPTVTASIRRVVPLPAPPPAPASPWDLVAAKDLRIGSKGLLASFSRGLEDRGRTLSTPPVVIGVFEHRRYFSPSTAQRYSELAGRCAFVVALAPGLGEEPAPRVRGVDLSDDPLLQGTWAVAVLHPHYAAAMIARDLGDAPSDRDRRFAFVLTHDHRVVTPLARCLLDRATLVGEP